MIIANALPPVLEHLSSWFEAIRQERHLAGLSAAVIHDHDTIWADGFGYADVERQTPATAQTVYAMCSVTKLLTATMLMQLRDSGLVHLDDLLTRYIPTFQMHSIYPDPPAITLRQVACHLAGLPKDFPVPYFDTLENFDTLVIPPIEHLLPTLPTGEVAFPPYTTLHYSNLGYALLGYALAQAVQQPYRAYMHKQILHPLGMHHSGFDRHMVPEVATGYLPQESDGSWKAAPVWEDGGLEPGGGLYSSVADMARFLSLQCGQSSQVLSGTTLREMRAPAWIDSRWEYGKGIGWSLRRFNQYTQIYHSGDGPGFSADVRLLPDLKLGLVIATNTNTDVSSIAQAALELLMPAFQPQPYWVQVPAGADAWQYTGRYRTGIADIELTISLTADRLQGQFTGDESFTLIPEGGRQFRMDGGFLAGEVLTFELDDHGHVSCIRFYGFTARPLRGNHEDPLSRDNR